MSNPLGKPLSRPERHKLKMLAKEKLQEAYSALETGMWAKASWRTHEATKLFRELAKDSRAQGFLFKSARLAAGCTHSSKKWTRDDQGLCHCSVEGCEVTWRNPNHV